MAGVGDYSSAAALGKRLVPNAGSDGRISEHVINLDYRAGVTSIPPVVRRAAAVLPIDTIATHFMAVRWGGVLIPNVLPDVCPCKGGRVNLIVENLVVVPSCNCNTILSRIDEDVGIDGDIRTTVVSGNDAAA